MKLLLVRGGMKAGDDVSSLVEGRRGLADALEVFAHYRPGTFLDGEEVRRIADGRERRSKENS